MDGYFTWQTLLTYSGATLATTVITQFLKEIKALDRLPTRILSYFTALVIMLASILATEGFAWGDLAIAAINAVVVALAANGAFDAVKRKEQP